MGLWKAPAGATVGVMLSGKEDRGYTGAQAVPHGLAGTENQRGCIFFCDLRAISAADAKNIFPAPYGEYLFRRSQMDMK